VFKTVAAWSVPVAEWSVRVDHPQWPRPRSVVSPCHDAVSRCTEGREASVGASQWYYTVDHQPDVSAALQQLRQEVYDRGDYYREPAEHDSDLDMTEEEFRAQLEPWSDNGQDDAILEDWLARKRRPVPVDPDTLCAAQPHSGTHSIIDMGLGVSDRPDLFTVSPLTGEELSEAFGSTMPLSSQVQEWMKSDGSGWRESWVGTYVISYRDGQPDHIHFCGFSGD
jgi:hypothetical protein